SIRFTGRESTDVLSTMAVETYVVDGTGSQTQSRWGDYSSVSVDPVDDCTLWYTTLYLKNNGAWNWSTRVQSIKFASCGGTPSADFSIGASPSSQSILPGDPTSFNVTVGSIGGFSGSVALSVSGLPSGATGSFVPTSIDGGAGASLLTINTTAATPTGS